MGGYTCFLISSGKPRRLQGFTGSESLPIDEVARSEPGTQCSLGHEGYPGSEGTSGKNHFPYWASSRGQHHSYTDANSDLNELGETSGTSSAYRQSYSSLAQRIMLAAGRLDPEPCPSHCWLHDLPVVPGLLEPKPLACYILDTSK